MVLLSIIIPTYNRFQLLRQAVESCLHQTYQEIEIIIIDDGSTDNTEEEVNKLLTSEWLTKPIIYYKQNNAGASAARNLGIKKSRGEFIQFLDSDDLLYPTKLKLQLEEITKHNADVCSSYGFMGSTFNANENEILGAPFEDKIDLMHKMCSGAVHVMCTPAPLWRKSIIDNVDGWNESIAFGDDLEYHIRLLTKVSKVCFVSEYLFFVREHSDFRLSDAKGNLKQIKSGIFTQFSIYDVLTENDFWDSVFQKGVLTNLKTLYANFMLLGNSKEIYEFESSLLKIAKKPNKINNIIILVATRRLLGVSFIMALFNIKKRIFS